MVCAAIPIIAIKPARPAPVNWALWDEGTASHFARMRLTPRVLPALGKIRRASTLGLFEGSLQIIDFDQIVKVACFVRIKLKGADPNRYAPVGMNR
jgi:hypothetical protein